MSQEFNATKTIWWIAHNNVDVFHYGQIYEGENLTTGQPFFETFDNKIDWDNRIEELLPADQYKDFLESKEQENELINNSLEKPLDSMLYTDSVEHLLYEDRGFRLSENINRRTD